MPPGKNGALKEIARVLRKSDGSEGGYCLAGYREGDGSKLLK